MSVIRLASKRKQQGMLAAASTKYRGAEQSRLRADWILGASSPDADIWERLTLRERARDLIRNDSVASGALDTIGDNVIGYGLMPQSRLNAEAVGFTDEQAREFQKQAERIFRQWCPHADVQGVMHFEDMQNLIVRQTLGDGEALVKRGFVDDEKWRPLGTAFECIEADQLAATSGVGSEDNIKHGIKFGPRGERLAYVFDKGGGTGSENTLEVPVRDEAGRPNIFHLYHMKRPGQVRGYSFLAPAMTLFKDRADYLEAEIVTARVLACFGVFITTQDDPYSAAQAGATVDGELKTDSEGNRLETLEPGIIEYLKAGEEINAVDPKRPGSQFVGFMEHVLRNIATSLNIPYELLFKDFSKTNYSSARAALLEAWRFFMRMRKWMVRLFCQPVWELVLEEAYLRRMIHAPNFYELKYEYTNATWIGPGRGWVDPVKEVTASVDSRKNRLTTLADEVAAQGRDWEEVLEQSAREEAKMAELGLTFAESQPAPIVEEPDTELTEEEDAEPEEE